MKKSQLRKINEYEQLKLELHNEKIKKAKRLDDLTKKYRRGLLLDEDVIDIIKVVFNNEK